MPDEFDDRMLHWGRAQREKSARDVPESFLKSMPADRRAEQQSVFVRFRWVGAWALAAAVIALAAIVWLNQRSVSPGPPGPLVGDESASPIDSVGDAVLDRRPTALALLIANDGYARDELVLPPGGSVTWTAKVPALGN